MDLSLDPEKDHRYLFLGIILGVAETCHRVPNPECGKILYQEYFDETLKHMFSGDIHNFLKFLKDMTNSDNALKVFMGDFITYHNELYPDYHVIAINSNQN